MQDPEGINLDVDMAYRPAMSRPAPPRPAWWMDTGPSFDWRQPRQPDGGIDWRATAYAGLLGDALQTSRWDDLGVPEINPVAAGMQKLMGHDAGTGAYFAAAAHLMDRAGQKNPWVYPAVAGIQGLTMLANRRFGVGGIPIPIISGKF
jgi:hypothetical protein